MGGGEFETVMQTRDAAEGLHKIQENLRQLCKPEMQPRVCIKFKRILPKCSARIFVQPIFSYPA